MVLTVPGRDKSPRCVATGPRPATIPARQSFLPDIARARRRADAFNLCCVTPTDCSVRVVYFDRVESSQMIAGTNEQTAHGSFSSQLEALGVRARGTTAPTSLF